MLDNFVSLRYYGSNLQFKSINNLETHENMCLEQERHMAMPYFEWICTARQIKEAQFFVKVRQLFLILGHLYIFIHAFASSGSLYLITPTCHGQKVRDHEGDTRKEASLAVGRQQPNSRTAICSCVRGGTRALTRAQQNDFQQVTRVHAPVPRGWCEGPMFTSTTHSNLNTWAHSDWQIWK